MGVRRLNIIPTLLVCLLFSGLPWQAFAQVTGGGVQPGVPESGTAVAIPFEFSHNYGLGWQWFAIPALLALVLMLRRPYPSQTTGSFHYQVFRLNILIVGGVILAFLALNSFLYYRDYKQHYAQLEQRLLAKAQKQLEQRVGFIRDFIRQEKNLAEDHLKTHLKSLVDRAFQSIDFLIRNSADQLGRAELTHQVMETLRPIRYSDGRGYMFATRLDGVELLFADHPELEGKNLLGLKDQDGVFYIQEMIRLCREQGEGFVSYRISKPGSDRWDHRKIAYVRYLPELDCFIGTGEYLDDFEAETQQIIAERLNSLQNSGDLTIFGGTTEGYALFGPARGKNAWDVVDRNGVKVVQELIRAAQAGGGFVTYQMPEIDAQTSYRKMSYAALIEDWNWYIGSGINLIQVENELDHAEQALQSIILNQILETVTLVSLLGIFLLLMARRISRRVTRNIDYLKESLDQAATHDVCINPNRIEYDEFAHIASAANAMLEQRLRMTRELQTREENLSVTLDSIGDAVIVTDRAGLVTRMNPIAEEMTGWTIAEAMGKPLYEVFKIVNAREGEKVVNPVQKVLATGQIVGLANHTLLIARDGRQYQIADSAAPIRGQDGTTQGVILVFRDVTEEYKLAQALRDSKERLHVMLSSAPLLIALLDQTGRPVFVNEHWQADTGFSVNQLLDQSLLELFPRKERLEALKIFNSLLAGEQQVCRLDTCLKTNSGGLLHIDLSLARISENHDEKTYILLMGKDISQRLAHEKKLEWLAMNDNLTELANRAQLLRFVAALPADDSTARNYWLFMFDLDRFKNVNDNYGHAIGDILLKEMGRRLKEFCPAQGLAARLSGDEFVLVTPLQDSSYAETMAHSLRELIRQPVECNGIRLQIDTSIGAVPIGTENASEILRRADLAMYQVKKQRLSSGVQIYNDILDAKVRSQMRLEDDLKIALKQPEQFILCYQPIWDIRSGRIDGLEALVRWQHPERGLVPPDDFIPLAEETALIVPLGDIVLQQACRDLAKWLVDFPELSQSTFRLSVNIAPQQLLTADMVEKVLSIIAEHDVPAEKLCLEITETAIMEEPDVAARRIHALKERGIHLAIDDFGTGYSSLGYMNRFRLDVIKLDRSLTQGVDVESTSRKVSQAMIRLAHDLQLKIVAEGVETTSQLETLEGFGCDCVQGFLTGHPLPVESIRPILQARSCPLLNPSDQGLDKCRQI